MSSNKQQKQETTAPQDDNLIELNIPHDNQLEQAMLASILLKPALILEAIELIKPADLYNRAHRTIFSAMIAIANRGGVLDLITLSSELNTNKEIEEIGGIAYLAQMMTGHIRPANINAYGAKIIQFATKRQVMRAGRDIANAALEEHESGTDLILHARNVLEGVAQRVETQGFTDIVAIARGELDRLQHLSEHQGQLLGIPTGFKDLDFLTCGLQPDDLIIVGARPSAGKTAFGLSLAKSAAEVGKKVGIFSIEMSKPQLVSRMLCGLARVDSHRARGGYLNRQEWMRLGNAQLQMADWKIFIDDNSDMNLQLMRAKSRRLQAEYGLDLLIVDYLQLMRPTEKKSSRQEEISEISRGAKALAKELHVPVVALCQLSRAAELHDEHRPQLSDLRESGSLEQDCDLAMLLYRAEMYDDTRTDDNIGIAEIIIAKQRNGPTDTIKAAFLKEFTTFEPLAKEQQ